MMKYVQAANIVGSNWRTCAGNGDYATLQRENGMEFCADKEDGWQVRDRRGHSGSEQLLSLSGVGQSQAGFNPSLLSRYRLLKRGKTLIKPSH